MGPGLARQEAAGRILEWFWNPTEQFFQSEPGQLAGYPDPLLTLHMASTTSNLPEVYTNIMYSKPTQTSCTTHFQTSIYIFTYYINLHSLSLSFQSTTIPLSENTNFIYQFV
jgi:hypothetical protein